MAGPWENYASPVADDAPWRKYQSAPSRSGPLMPMDLESTLTDPEWATQVINQLPEDKREAARRQWSDALVAKERAGGGVLQRADDTIRRIATSVPVLGAWADEANAATGALLGQDYDMRLAYERAKDRAIEATPTTKLATLPVIGDVTTGGLEQAAGVVGGALALPVAKVFKSEGFLPAVGNTAITAGGYSAADAAGAAEADKLLHGAEGGVIGLGIGGAFGGLANRAAPIAAYVGDKLKGVVPGEAAIQRLKSALLKDAKQGETMSWRDYAAASSRGQPVMNLDVGGSRVLRQARSAVDTSDEAEAILSGAARKRSLEGAPAARIERELSGMQPKTASGLLEDIRAEAIKSRKPLYDSAFAEGKAGIESQSLESLKGSPTFRKNMGEAETRILDREAAAEAGSGSTTGLHGGYPSKSVPVYGPSGNISDTISTETGKSAEKLRTLEFWDAVKVSIDDDINGALAKGANGRARELINLRDSLVAGLDDAVPSYPIARGEASRLFGTADAVEAGKKLAGKQAKYDNDAARKAIADMTPQERKALEVGYISSVRGQIQESVTSGERNVAATLLNSTASRDRAEMVLGPQKAKALRKYLETELRIAAGYKALEGGPKTARWLTETLKMGGSGTTGGLLGLYYGGDREHALAGMAAGLGGRAASRQRATAVADNIARLLASDDIGAIMRALPSQQKKPIVDKLTKALMKGAPRTAIVASEDRDSARKKQAEALRRLGVR